jgi:hypothetical protein
MRWVLLWVVLLLSAAAVYAALAVRLWRSGKALARELATMSARLEALGSQPLADWTQAHHHSSSDGSIT